MAPGPARPPPYIDGAAQEPRCGGIPSPVIGIDSAQKIEEEHDSGEALVPVAGYLGLEPDHAVLDLVLLGDAAHGEQHVTVTVAPCWQDRLVPHASRLVRPGTAQIPSAAIRSTSNGLL
jgi:hypothetical protein